MYGSIEAGGTKFVCAIGNDDLQIIEKITFETSSPRETLQKTFDFFDKFNLKSIGIGSFGPIDINPKSSTYGYIKNTPKLLWKNFNFRGEIVKKYNIPVGWTTDVNIAALAEATKGAGRELNNVLYLTVGTGIGGGVIINGKIFDGFSHPEMGHIMIKKKNEYTFSSFRSSIQNVYSL